MKSNKLKVSLVGIAVFIIFLIETAFVSKGYTSYVYDRWSDIIFFLIALAMCIYSVINLQKDKKNLPYYLVIANLFLMVLVIHLLRFIFGGLLC